MRTFPRSHSLTFFGVLLTAGTMLPSSAVVAQVSRCAGDCGNVAHVNPQDLLTVLGVALGKGSAVDCPAGDADRDGTITVDDLLAAVNAAVSGCPPTATPTVTATPTATLTPRPPTDLVDFGAAPGMPGAQAQLPLVARSDLTPGSLRFEIAFDDSVFAFLLCLPSIDEIDVTTLNPEPGIAIVNVVPNTPDHVFTIPAGTFANCIFQVNGGPGAYPISLVGNFVTSQGDPFPIASTGVFTVQCADDTQCKPAQRCVSRQCVTPDLQINTYTAGTQDEPAVCSDAAGEFVVAFRNLNHIVARRYSSTAVRARRIGQWSLRPALQQCRRRPRHRVCGQYVHRRRAE